MDLMVGVDLGGTFTKFGLVTEEGELIAENVTPTDTSLQYSVFFEQLYRKIEQLHTSEAPLASLKGIGIGAPSGNYLTGQIENASNLAWPKSIPVAKLLSGFSGLPVAVTNDANAAALGEMKYGVARNVDNFISLTLGTGLGCGVVINGKMVAGNNGHAGELGHTIAVENGRKCGCGRYGCLETYASAPGLRNTLLQKLAESQAESVFRNRIAEKITAQDITKAASAGDQLSLDAFNRTGEILGRKLADTVAFLNPALIVISGGLANAGKLILEPTQTHLEKNLLYIFQGTVSVKLSEMSKKNAAILGAAAMMWEQDAFLSDAQYV